MLQNFCCNSEYFSNLSISNVLLYDITALSTFGLSVSLNCSLCLPYSTKMVIYSSFNKIDVKKFLREVEFRVKIYNNSILKLFYTLSDKKFIFSEYILNTYFLILVFNPDVKFGLADHYLTKMVEKIKNTLVD